MEVQVYINEAPKEVLIAPPTKALDLLNVILYNMLL